jgi:alkanesulfonate monooxygenase SsuD/methylene tetrahydromethanopterin reductase-like flavin-dependent oxidoreductase (luciferase family)
MLEKAGFDAIWMGENINRTNFTPDTIQMLLLAAAATNHVEVGTTIIEVPLRNPAELALRLLTTHMLTGGRFVAGLGAGSTKADFDACGVDFEQRFSIMSRSLPMIRKLLKGETVGESINLKPPPEIAGGPPMIIGAWASGIWVKRAARDYDGWMASGHPANRVETLAEGMKVFRENGGKRALIVTVGVDLTAETKPMAGGPFNLRCDAKEAAARLQYLVELGFDDVHLVGRPEQTEEDLLAIRALLPKQD